MSRLANLRTGPTEYDYGQLPCNHGAYGERDVTDCEFPRAPPKVNKTWERNTIWGIIGTALFVNACFLGVAIAFTVFFAVKSPNFGGYSSDSPEYALYKNTRFEECYKAPASTTNCTDIRPMKDTRIPGFGDNDVGFVASNKDWCEFISCFHDYKVIPSTQRDSAVWPTLLTSWAASAGFIVGSLVQLALQQKALYSPKKKPCKGLRDVHWYSWMFIVLDLGSFVWWWVTFGKLVAARESASTPFIIGWVIPWKYAGLFRYHPFSCAFRENRRRRNVARCIFYILAAIQWTASLYVIHVNWPHPMSLGTSYGLRAPNPNYDCVQSQIDAAPGTSTCSATQICSRNWLFVDPGFEPAYLHTDPMIVMGIMFLGLTIAAFFPLFMMCMPCICRDKSPDSSPRKMLRWADPGPVAMCSIISLLQIVGGGILVGDMVKKLSVTPDAAVTVDWKCQAVHVALSPWRYYIDVDYEKGWRIAKLWFNS